MQRQRRGTVLPTLGVCLISLFGFVGLAIDLGMMAVCANAVSERGGRGGARRRPELE